MADTLDSIYVLKQNGRINQGDIFSGVKYKMLVMMKGSYALKEIEFPYAVVLTQDCDLSQNYNSNKFLQSILVCPIFLAEKLRYGEHLDNIGVKELGLNKSLWKRIIKNDDKRYHYFDDCDVHKLTKLVIDFKQYFTIPREEAYDSEFLNKYKVSLRDIFKEDLSMRFANFLSRIPIPEVNKSNNGNLNGKCDIE